MSDRSAIRAVSENFPGDSPVAACRPGSDRPTTLLTTRSVSAERIRSGGLVAAALSEALPERWLCLVQQRNQVGSKPINRLRLVQMMRLHKLLCRIQIIEGKCVIGPPHPFARSAVISSGGRMAKHDFHGTNREQPSAGHGPPKSGLERPCLAVDCCVGARGFYLSCLVRGAAWRCVHRFIRIRTKPLSAWRNRVIHPPHELLGPTFVCRHAMVDPGRGGDRVSL